MGLFDIFKSKVNSSALTNGAPLPGHPLRGFLNMGTFEVHGTNPATGKNNKRVIVAVDDADAILKGRGVGLVDPITAVEIETEMATERQIAYASDLGIIVPLCATKIDVSALICRANDGDTGAVSSDVIKTATASGVVMSSLSGPTLSKSMLK